MSFKNKNIVRQFPFFTHFVCLPLNGMNMQQFIVNTQQQIESKLEQQGFSIEQTLKRQSHLLTHLTLFMLTLRRQQIKDKLSLLLHQELEAIRSTLNKLQLQFTGVKYFTRVNKSEKCNQLTVIYLQIDNKSQQVLQSFINYMTKLLLKHEIIVPEELKSMRINYNHQKGVFQLETFHISLFRCKGLMEKGLVKDIFTAINEQIFSFSLKQLSVQQNGLEENNLKQKEIFDKQATMKISCQYLDVSTMMAFDESQFYQPFLRVNIQENDKPKSQQKNGQQELELEQN